MPVVRDSYESLASQYEVIILEGAGSPAEINLKDHDIVNMRMAELADARCLLVGDIDRGGVFASLLGTVELLEPEEQRRIHGFAINKFRGDPGLLEPGIRMMEDRLKKPCLGVVPYLHDLVLDEEDSLGLAAAVNEPWPRDDLSDRALRIAVIAVPSFSNFTDFDALRAESSISLRFTRTVGQLLGADIVILPGSKQTVEDLLWLREHRLDQAVKDHAQSGLVVGICGGMQMLGASIADPLKMEYSSAVDGLDLLPIHTIMQPRKVTSVAHGVLAVRTLFGQVVSPIALSGYEIHIGETTYLERAGHFASILRGNGSCTQHSDGCVASNGRVIGTYLHGIFDDDDFRHVFIQAARAFHQLVPSTEFANWKALRAAELDRLAAEVESALDMERIFAWADCTYALPSKDTARQPVAGAVR